MRIRTDRRLLVCYNATSTIYNDLLASESGMNYDRQRSRIHGALSIARKNAAVYQLFDIARAFSTRWRRRR